MERGMRIVRRLVAKVTAAAYTGQENWDHIKSSMSLALRRANRAIGLPASDALRETLSCSAPCLSEGDMLLTLVVEGCVDGDVLGQL
eukprot:6399865-Amphidinium_carterae.2